MLVVGERGSPWRMSALVLARSHTLLVEESVECEEPLVIAGGS